MNFLSLRTTYSSLAQNHLNYCTCLKKVFSTPQMMLNLSASVPYSGDLAKFGVLVKHQLQLVIAAQLILQAPITVS